MMPRLTWLILILLLGDLSAQQSPNGPPGPEGNPNNGDKGNEGEGNEGEGNEVEGNEPIPPTTVPPTTVPPATDSGASLPPQPAPDTPESSANRLALLRLARNIFDARGNVDPVLLVPTIKLTANVAGLSSAMSEQAEGAAVATDNNIEQRMTQIRDASFHSANLFLTDLEHESAIASTSNRKFGLWLVESGLLSRTTDSYTRTGTMTAGTDLFIDQHAAIGLLGVYGYSNSRISGIKGRLYGNAKIGGIYGGAWTGKPGLYVSLSTLLNETDFRLIGQSSSHLVNWTGFGSIGYETSGPCLTWGPVVSVQYDHGAANGFDLDGLHTHRNVTETLQSRAGARASYKKTLCNGQLKAQVQIMWEHHYAGSGAVDVDYIGIPNSGASIGQGALNRDSLWSSASISYHLKSGLSLYAAYSLDLAGNFSIQQVDLGFHISF